MHGDLFLINLEGSVNPAKIWIASFSGSLIANIRSHSPDMRPKNTVFFWMFGEKNKFSCIDYGIQLNQPLKNWLFRVPGKIGQVLTGARYSIAVIHLWRDWDPSAGCWWTQSRHLRWHDEHPASGTFLQCESGCKDLINRWSSNIWSIDSSLLAVWKAFKNLRLLGITSFVWQKSEQTWTMDSSYSYQSFKTQAPKNSLGRCG